MKKIALFSLVFCLCGVYAVPSFATCGGHTLGFDGNQDPDDDEFLYENIQQFNLTKKGYENSNEQNSGDGKGIECDTTNSAGCTSGAQITLGAGHVFKGVVINTKRTYKCDFDVWDGDYWDNVTPWCDTKICGKLEPGRSCSKKLVLSECSGVTKTENNYDAVTYWEMICRDGGVVVCKPQLCRYGYELDIGNGKCVKKCPECDQKPKQCVEVDGRAVNAGEQFPHDEDCSKLTEPDMKTGKRCQKWCYRKKNGDLEALWGIVECPAGYRGVVRPNANDYTPVFKTYDKCVKQVDPVERKTCREKRKTVEGLACCDLPKSEATYDEKTGKCNCKDGKEFKIVDGKGQCVAKEAPVEPVKPVVEEGECEYYIKAGIECGDGNYYLEEGWQKVKKSAFEGKQCSEIKNILDNDVNRLKELFKDLCKPAGSIVIKKPDNAKVEQAQKVLSDFTASAKDEASVWKTSEGKFNTTRLASDITAGVVLGTVGGVVTGNVIKKNQVKKGFEALHCTVGGQKVADWGDEFNIGLRR